MNIYENIFSLIGNSPMVKLNNYAKYFSLTSNIIAKLESFNPASSIKDRIGFAMIADAEEKGLITKDTLIVEPTSGNTGIALAYISASKGYKLILTMPESMSIERRMLLKALGADLILTPASEGMKGAVKKAEEIIKSNKNAFMPQQFNNKANVEIHKKTTAEEIWKDTEGKIDYFVAGIGTGGTITGVGEVLKKRNPDIKIIAVEPADSAILSGGKPGPHKIQGIGAGFVPNILNTDIIDNIIKVANDDAYSTAKFIAKNEGILAGISSGAALYASMQIAKKVDNKNIVVIFPDTGERYLSVGLYE